MQRILLLLLVFVCATANSQVFRRIGPDGQVYFSDQPGPGAEQIEVPPVQTMRLPPENVEVDATAQPNDAATEQQGDVTTVYTGFTIVNPTSEQSVRANDGSVTVYLSLQPELMPGHAITLKIDGEDGKEIFSGDSMAVQLTNLSRGRHTVEVTVVSEEGNNLIQAGPVSFYVLRAATGGR
jgi:hypothetical protein